MALLPLTASIERDQLVERLREFLGKDPTIRLVILHGSRAREDQRRDSDIDLVVDAVDSDWTHLHGLACLVEDHLRLRPQLMSLDQARQAPASLADAIRDGVPVIDRAGVWAELRADSENITAAALAETTRMRWAVIETFESLGLDGDIAAPFVAGERGTPLVDGLTRKAWLQLEQLPRKRAVLRSAREELTEALSGPQAPGSPDGAALAAALMRRAGGSDDPDTVAALTALKQAVLDVGCRIDELILWGRRATLGNAAHAGVDVAWRWLMDVNHGLAPERADTLRRAVATARRLAQFRPVSPAALSSAAMVLDEGLSDALALAGAAWTETTP